jgi:hypothetical protein
VLINLIYLKVIYPISSPCDKERLNHGFLI